MATTVLKRHPIRGFLWGILFGLGVFAVAVGQGWAALGTWPSFLVFVVGVVVATLWGTFGPSKAPKGPPPVEPTHAEPVESTRFDDFDRPTRDESLDESEPVGAEDESSGASSPAVESSEGEALEPPTAGAGDSDDDR